MNLSLLREPFKAEEIEWRLGQCGKTAKGFWGKCFAYVQARAIMDRLDEVVGPTNWKATSSFLDSPRLAAGVICQLSIYDEEGEQWVTKEDGSEPSDMDAFKGGISGALKRAAVVWGIGRYLYSLESGFAEIVDKGTAGALYGQTKEKESFYWLPPQLPAWALPKSKETVNTTTVKITPKATVMIPSGAMIGTAIGRTIPSVQDDVPHWDNWDLNIGRPIGDAERQHVASLAESRKWQPGQVADLIKRTTGKSRVTELTLPEYQELTATISTKSYTDTLFMQSGLTSEQEHA
jgi:hypothetical protein